MKMIMGLALIGLAGLLGYEIWVGNALTIINSFRQSSNTTNNTNSSSNNQSSVLTPTQTPQVGGNNAPGQSNPQTGMAVYTL